MIHPVKDIMDITKAQAECSKRSRWGYTPAGGSVNHGDELMLDIAIVTVFPKKQQSWLFILIGLFAN